MSFSVPKYLKITKPEGGPSKRGVQTKVAFSEGVSVYDFTPDLRVNDRRVTRDEKPNPQSNGTGNYTEEEIESFGEFCAFCNQDCLAYGDLSEPDKITSTAYDYRPKYIGKIQKSLRCSYCQKIVYCSPTCQRNDWKACHHMECSFMKNVDVTLKNGLSTYDRALLRLYIMCSKDRKFHARVKLLTSHIDSLRLNGSTETAADLSFLIKQTIKKNKALNVTRDIDGDIEHLGGILMVNAAVFQNSFCEDTGLSFDSFFSLINHSCDPNTTLVMYKKNATLLTLRKLQPGTELTVNYTVTSVPTEIRQHDLQERFFFTCKCRICVDKFDRYFSFNCSKCDSITCGLILRSFFKPGTEAMIFKNKGNPDMCFNCKRTGNLTQIMEAKSILEALMTYYVADCLLNHYLHGGAQPHPIFDDKDEYLSVGKVVEVEPNDKSPTPSITADENAPNSGTSIPEFLDNHGNYLLNEETQWEPEYKAETEEEREKLKDRVTHTKDASKSQKKMTEIRSNLPTLADSMVFAKKMFNKHGYLDFLLQGEYMTFKILRENIDTTRNLVDAIRASKIVPLYCFPIPRIMEGIVNYDRIHQVDTLITLKYEILLTLECYIPVDISSVKYTLGNQLKEIATAIMARITTGTFVDISITDRLIPACLFFGLQAYYYLSKIYPDSVPIVHDLVSMISAILIREKSDYTKLWLNGISDGKFSGALKRFADLLVLDMDLERKILFADKNRKKIFQPCSMLRFEKFGLSAAS